MYFAYKIDTSAKDFVTEPPLVLDGVFGLTWACADSEGETFEVTPEFSLDGKSWAQTTDAPKAIGGEPSGWLTAGLKTFNAMQSVRFKVTVTDVNGGKLLYGFTRSAGE